MFFWLKRVTSIWIERFSPPRKLITVDGDSLPSHLPRRDLVLARDDGEDWCVGMRCPCGCGRTIELLVIPEASPRWNVTRDDSGCPTLHPSVHMKNGCKSHFWLHRGRVKWCK